MWFAWPVRVFVAEGDDLGEVEGSGPVPDLDGFGGDADLGGEGVFDAEEVEGGEELAAGDGALGGCVHGWSWLWVMSHPT